MPRRSAPFHPFAATRPLNAVIKPRSGMGLFKKTKTASQALVEVGAPRGKRTPTVLLLKNKPETKKQSPRLLKFSAARLASRASTPERTTTRLAGPSKKELYATTFERRKPPQTSPTSTKPLLDSTKCGGELKVLLKEFAQALLCDNDFSCRIEREINEQRKSAHKSILVSLHASNAGNKRCEVLFDNHGFGRNRDFASGQVFWLCLTHCASFKALPQCPKLVDDLNAERMRNASKTSGPAPGVSARCSTPSTSFCEAARADRLLQDLVGDEQLRPVGHAGGEFGIGFGVDATKKEEIFEAMRVEFAPAAAFSEICRLQGQS